MGCRGRCFGNVVSLGKVFLVRSRVAVCRLVVGLAFVYRACGR